MSRGKRLALIVIVFALWAAVLVPFFVGTLAAHPATDDFTFAAYTRRTWLQTHSLPHVVKDALSYALRTYRDWQGTIVGCVIMALNPAVFSIAHYGAHAVVLLLINLIAWFVFLRRMLRVNLGMGRSAFLAAYAALSAMLLAFLPDMVEGIYWFNGAWFYMGAQAVSLLTLTLADVLCVRERRGSNAALWLLCAGLLLALGLDNYITAMMTAAAIFMMALGRLWTGYAAQDEAAKAAQRRAAIRAAVLLVPIGIGLLIAVLAPGNAVRMETDGAHESGLGWILMSIGWTLRDAVKYIVRFALKTPLLALLLAATPAMLRWARGERAKRIGRLCPPVWLTALGFYLILCAMIVPHMYSSGYAGSGRVVNMYHCYVLTFGPVAYAMGVLRIAQGMQGEPCTGCKACRKKASAFYAGAAAALMLCVVGGQIGNYVKLVSDQIDGTQDAYIAQFRNEYALCEAAGEGEDVVLPAWTVQTVTGKPTAYEDAAMWTNESMATYFGVKSVRVGE